MTDDISDLGDRVGVVRIEHFRSVTVFCDKCGVEKDVNDGDDYKAYDFIERHNKKCG